MEELIRWWLKAMKWFFVLFFPIACIIMLALPIWKTLNPWEQAKEKLNEQYPSNYAIQIAGGSSSSGYSENRTESQSATFILFPRVFTTFNAVTYYEVNDQGEFDQGTMESTWVLLWIIFFDVALFLVSIFWSYPKIKGAFTPSG